MRQEKQVTVELATCTAYVTTCGFDHLPESD